MFQSKSGLSSMNDEMNIGGMRNEDGEFPWQAGI